MTVKTGQVWAGLAVTKDSTGALATPGTGPAGVLYVNGTANAATVTITGSNPYKWSVTLPSLTAGDCVSMYITATIATIATASVVAEDVSDTKRASDLNDIAATAIVSAGAITTSSGAVSAVTTVGSVTGAVGSVTGAVGSVTGAVGSVTAGVTVATGGITAASIATNAIDADALAADAVVEIAAGITIPSAATIADAVLDEASVGHSGFLTTLALEATAQSILTDTGTTLDALVKDIPTNAELATALGTADDATLAAIAALSIPAASAVADAVWDEALAGHAGAGSAGLALATASSGGVDPSVLADAIWDEALSGHSTAGTSGKKLTDLANADLSGVATATALATVDTVVDAILVDTGTTLDALIQDLPTNAELTAALADLPTNAELATALGTADDAVLAAIAALNNLSSAGAQAAAAAALTAYGAALQTSVDDLEGRLTATRAGYLDNLSAGAVATAAALTAVDDYVDAEVAAIKAVTDKIDTGLVLDGAVYQWTANALELAPTGGSAPTAAQIRAEIDSNSTQLAAIVADTGTDIPATLAGLATATALSTVAGYIDTEVAAILAAVDTEVTAILEDTGTTLPASLAALATAAAVTAVKAILDKLDTALELDGAVYRFTVNALELGPAGGAGGTSDWTAGEREQIRHRLGVDGDVATPATNAPHLGTVDANIVEISGDATAADNLESYSDGTLPFPAHVTSIRR